MTYTMLGHDLTFSTFIGILCAIASVAAALYNSDAPIFSLLSNRQSHSFKSRWNPSYNHFDRFFSSAVSCRYS